MPPTIRYQHTDDGSLVLANADDVDLRRDRLHARFALTTYEDALATTWDVIDTDLLTELYQEDAPDHVELDVASLPDDPDLWPAPHRSWDITSLVRRMEDDHPTSLLADPFLDLPGGLEHELYDLAEERGGWMSAPEPHCPAAIADDVLRRLAAAGADLVPDAGLVTPHACIEGWCSCDPTDRDRRQGDSGLHRMADAILPRLWIGDGEHVPSARFDTVVTVTPGLGAAVAPIAATHVVSTFADSRWQPLDREPIETAVAATLDAWRRGDTVLVRCQAGINRSSLVVGETLARLGWPRETLVDLIRDRRPQALSNPFFVDVLRAVVDTDMQAVTLGGQA